MVKIMPLKGLTYSKDKIADFSTVITPPNDVISEQKKEELKQKSKLNFVNLILPDGDGDKYDNSAGLFEKWKKESVFETDKEENVYVYSQSYEVGGKKYCRIGFIALIELEDLGKGVLPHENILEDDLKDRIALISTTEADFGIPFLLYDDRERIADELTVNVIMGKEPDIDFVDEEQVNHKLWKISDIDYIEKLSAEMKKYQCIIADGHHRYTSELKVRYMLNNNNAKYGLMCFVNSFNEGMIILPTNRVVSGLEDVDMRLFLERLNRYFEVDEVLNINELVKKVDDTITMIDKTTNTKNHVIGIYSNINKKGYFLRLKNRYVLNEFYPNRTDIYRKLDANILHKILIEETLGITPEQQRKREHIDFVKGNIETMEKMKDKNMQFGFFVKPPLLREVFLTARADETMPMKSTYFYPKVFSGLVVYDFGE